jgi:predicted transcriptional regulator of viral defense system
MTASAPHFALLIAAPQPGETAMYRNQAAMAASLLAGAVDADDVRRQLSRWVNAGRLYQLRRGLYALAPPFQRARPHPFLVANRLVRGSYVSQQAALAHYGLIPEAAPVVTSVMTGRPGRW